MKQNTITTYLIILIFLLLGKNLKAQDIEAITKAPWLNVSGGISINQVHYSQWGQYSKKDPYTYYVNSNINTSILGVVNMPVSFSYSNADFGYSASRPFNRFSLSPSYKNIKTYIGYSSLTFSPYTLSAHEFLGGGVEVSFKNKIKLTTLYGRFVKAIEPDSLNNYNPTYKRMGFGFKSEIKGKKLDLDLTLFTAKDDENSVNKKLISDTTTIKPKSNTAIEISTKIKFIKNLYLETSFSFSALNDDSRDKRIDGNGITSLIFKPTSSVAYYKAIKSSLNYTLSNGSIGCSYEKTDPEYKTLGAYYFTNDFENIALNVNSSILKKKVNVSGSIGIQKDNIENQKSASSKRISSSINTQINATKKLRLSISYSNLQSYSYIKPILQDITSHTNFENLDTLNFTQINQTINSNLNYMLSSSKTKIQNLNFNFSYQQAADQQGDNKKTIANKMYNTVGTYSFSHTPSKASFTLSSNHNYNELKEFTSQMFGVNLSAKKSFFKRKLKTTLSSGFANSYSDNKKINTILNIRLNNSYTLKKKHNFSLNITYINNKSKTRKFSELSFNMSYSFNFGFSIKRKNKKV